MKNSKRPVTKAIIAAAGYGTRFLPATKNQPKEMLPIIDKPIIHYLVEEAVNSGIKDIIIVTRAGNHIMEDYFDNHYELEDQLEKAGKTARLETVRNIPQMANFIYVRQKKNLPYGNGSPLLAAKNLIDDDEAVVYMFGDDLWLAENPATKQVIDYYEKYSPTAVIAAYEVPIEETYRYGVFKYKENEKIPHVIEDMVEKPKPEEAPSNIINAGRFVLSYDVIEEMTKTSTSQGNELWLTDALGSLAKKDKIVMAPPLEGEWLTTGDPLRFIKATLRYALQREDLRDDLLEFIKQNGF